MKKSEKMMAEYDKSARTYNPRYSKIQNEKYQKALSGVELTGKMLDLGSGTGLLKEFLQTKWSKAPRGRANKVRSVDVIGADISLNMLLQGSEGAVQAQAEFLPFKDKTFDYILSFSALMNFEDHKTALKEIQRVMKKNGLFICTYLRKFDFEKILKKKFRVIGKRFCGEDVCFYLKKKPL